MEHNDCCDPYVHGPRETDRKILYHGMLFEIHGEGDTMTCTFTDQITGRTDECPDPPQPILDRMAELKG